MESVKAPKIQRSEEDIFRMMEEFDQSENVSVKDFCEMYEISTASFYNWQRQYKGRVDKSEGFVTLSVTEQADHMPIPLFAEVRGIRIFQAVTASFLKELLQ